MNASLSIFAFVSICYAIKDWEKHFENSESRKVKSLTWVPVKNKHDGKGYRRVCQHPKSIQVFCAWNLIIQVASKMPMRGLLRDEDGPLTTSDLSMKTGYPEHIFEEAFKVLSDSKIGWLIVHPSGDARKLPDAPGNISGEQNRTEGNIGERESGGGRAKNGRLHGIPATVEEVITLGANLRPKKDEDTCRAFWAHYEGQARTNENGETFWITSGDAVVTNWRVKLATFGEQQNGKHSNNGKPNISRNTGTYNAQQDVAALARKVR